MTQVHLVAIDGEDFLLRVTLLDLNSEDRFLDLSFEGLLIRQAKVIAQVSRQLLGERARPLSPAPLHDVGDGSHEDAPDVHAEMAVEFGIFGGDDCLAEQWVDVVVADDHAALRRKFADYLAVGGVNARNRAGCVIVECRDLRQIAGVGEEHATEGAEHRHDNEQQGDAGSVSYAHDIASHRIANC
jgi:hypothetical protein